MSMKSLEKLRELLCSEIDEIAEKGELSTGDLETIHKLTDTVKNIDKIEMCENTGYSGAGDWEADMRGTFGRGRSYANGGRHYVRGHYSRSNGKHTLIAELERLSDDVDDDRTRDMVRRLIEDLKTA